MRCNNRATFASKLQNLKNMKKLAVSAALWFVVIFGYAQQAPAIRVEKSGSGKAILFLPGFTTPGSVWKETVKNLDFKYESHLVSYAGFNKIAPIAVPWYETVKKDLLEYIQQNKLSHIHIIGHSMGGNLAVDIAAAMPGNVDRIILVDAIPCMRELMMPGVSASQLQYDSPYNNQMLNMSDEAFRQTASMMAQAMTDTKEKVDSLMKWSIEADRKTFVYGYTDLLKLDLREVLDKVTAKTLILGAPFPNKDLVKANMEKQYAKLANKTIEIAEGGKHFIMFDQPQWFYDKVNTFFAK